MNSKCVGTSPSGFCARFYVTQPDAHNAGSLLAWQYADAHPEYQASIENGPAVLAKQIIDDGSFAACTTKKLFTFLMKRDPELDGTVFDIHGTASAAMDAFSRP